MILRGLDLNHLGTAKSYRSQSELLLMLRVLHDMVLRYLCVLCNMQQLYLAGNQITSLSSLPELPNLEVMMLPAFFLGGGGRSSPPIFPSLECHLFGPCIVHIH